MSHSFAYSKVVRNTSGQAIARGRYGREVIEERPLEGDRIILETSEV